MDNRTRIKLAFVAAKAANQACNNYRKNDDRLDDLTFNLALIAQTLGEFEKYFAEHRDHEDSVVLKIGFTEVKRMMDQVFGILAAYSSKATKPETETMTTEIEQLEGLARQTMDYLDDINSLVDLWEKIAPPSTTGTTTAGEAKETGLPSSINAATDIEY
jgi:hypothetical protein